MVAAALKCKLSLLWDLPRCKLHFPTSPPKKGGGRQKCIITFLTYQKMMKKKKYSLHFDGGESPKTVSYI